MGAAALFFILVLVVTVVAELPLWVVAWQSKRMTWWRAQPVSTELNGSAAAMSVAGTHAARRRGWITMVRCGRDNADSELWLGFSSGCSPRQAESLAKAAGCELAESKAPPPAASRRTFWYGSVPPSGSGGPEEGARVLLDSLAREQLIDEWESGFAEYADTVLDSGDYLVVSMTMDNDQSGRHRQMLARAATTSRSLARSWSWPGPDQQKLFLPSVSAILALVLGLAAGALSAAAFGVFGGNTSIPLGVVHAGTALMGFYAGVHGSIRTRRGRAVGEYWHLPMRWWQTRKLSPVDATLAAAYLSGGEQTATSARARNAPEALTRADGVVVGRDKSGREVWLHSGERQNGVFIIGDQGTGKTTLALGVWRGDVQDWLGGGKRSSLWLETKGEGAARATKVCKDAGGTPLVLNLSDPSGVRLELIDWEDPARSAHLITEAMKYAFDPGDIMGQSESVLKSAFRAAIGCDAESARELGYHRGRPNAFELAWHLLGGERADGKEKAALDAINRRPNHHSTELLSMLPPHTSARESRDMFRAALNKFNSFMLGVRPIFEVGDRPHVSLAQLIAGQDADSQNPTHHISVLNFAPPRAGLDRGVGYTETTAERMIALVFFCLWDTVQRTCDGWQQKGFKVSVFSDELSQVAGLGGGNLDIVEEMSTKGRARGLELVLATQHYQQIPEKTLEAAHTFGTKMVFRVEGLDIANRASADLEGVYTYEELRSLKRFECAARMRADGIPQQAFTLRPAEL